jgi:hypothetical protein
MLSASENWLELPFSVLPAAPEKPAKLELEASERSVLVPSSFLAFLLPSFFFLAFCAAATLTAANLSPPVGMTTSVAGAHASSPSSRRPRLSSAYLAAFVHCFRTIKFGKKFGRGHVSLNCFSFARMKY